MDGPTRYIHAQTTASALHQVNYTVKIIFRFQASESIRVFKSGTIGDNLTEYSNEMSLFSVY